MISEKPILFGRSGTLVGVHCTPGAGRSPGQSPTVLFLNAGIVHRVGCNRLYVNLARGLARRGVASLRFDLGGVGDSRVAVDPGEVQELVLRDIRDAIDYASRENNGRGVVLMGLCSGADNAFEAAVKNPRVVGAILLDPNAHQTAGFYVRHYLRALFDRTMWTLLLSGRHPVARRLRRMFSGETGARPQSVFLAPTTLAPRETLRSQISALLERDCALLYVFTAGLRYRYNYENQFAHTFPDLVKHPRLGTAYFGASDHTFSDPNCQQQLLELVGNWIAGQLEPGLAKPGSAERKRDPFASGTLVLRVSC